ncbi:LysR family transcriptional regulator [Rhizobium sp. BE258]|uniref:LysR family transcriptional regulator n=1 Tax=Rhizobium sp. BE258 TaxID=2817722 RepID=UPI002855CF32|nr:LysR family transcriptional regulator [Rhizobium sp. BE258]MDR7144061.1 DNA-binding transcriptional LysR family regulator [Rhizobium sp. BE258]
MESLINLESFVRTAELGSFSAAARRLAVTPAAVSRNVAVLEANLGIRLFQRSTRSLTLTEAGERFLQAIGDNLSGLQNAIASAASDEAAPSGTLRVSMSPTLGIGYILPLLPDFLARYPLIRPEWMFENRQVDLIAEGYDAAIGGGFELAPGVIARTLAPAHIIAVASPAYMRGRSPPEEPSDMASLDGIVMRANRTGKIRLWQMRNVAGDEQAAAPRERVVVDDPAAMREAALMGIGVAMIAKPDALPHLERGDLIRVVPQWYVDAGPVSIYYSGRKLLPLKTRVFIDFVLEASRRENWAERFTGSLGEHGP